MKVLMVSSEILPLVKTGGLADVVGSLSAALSRSVGQVMKATEGKANPEMVNEILRRKLGN